jgi:hypothetical protein
MIQPKYLLERSTEIMKDTYPQRFNEDWRE